MRCVAAVLVGALAVATTAGGTRPGAELVEERGGHVVRPAVREPTDALVARLRLQPGFRITRFADGLGRARMLAVADDGTVFVTRPDAGEVMPCATPTSVGPSSATFPACTTSPSATTPCGS